MFKGFHGISGAFIFSSPDFHDIFVGPAIWCPEGQSKKNTKITPKKRQKLPWRKPRKKRETREGGRDGATARESHTFLERFFFCSQFRNILLGCFDDLLKLLCLSRWFLCCFVFDLPRFFDPVTALESVISLRFRALLGFAKVCPLSGPATCHVLWCFWLLELRHSCPFGQDNNICHGYPMCFAQTEVGNTAEKNMCFYWFLIREWCWFWLILSILMS